MFSDSEMVEDLQLTFKDGTPVGEGQLEQWLEDLEADENVTGTTMLLARSIVRYLRIHAN